MSAAGHEIGARNVIEGFFQLYLVPITWLVALGKSL